MIAAPLRRVLVAMLRTPRGRQNHDQLAETLRMARGETRAALADMALRGLVQQLPGVWDGSWYELTPKGERAAAWLIVRDHIGASEESLAATDGKIGVGQ